jgi:hypothetical protein
VGKVSRVVGQRDIAARFGFAINEFLIEKVLSESDDKDKGGLDGEIL